MRRQTHLAVGALCAVQITTDLAPTVAVGALVCCLAGAIVPDYLDLRSDFQGLLRHRGISHSALAAVLATVAVYFIVDALSRVDLGEFSISASMIQRLSIAFAIGFASHLVLDAFTTTCIRPALPCVGWRLCLLPRRLRIRTGGRVDAMIRWLAATAATILLVGSLVRGL